jgi:hypothetical protein
MGKTFTEQLRAAIAVDQRSLGALSKASGVDKGTLSRFMARKCGMGLPAVDRLVDVLGLELKPRTEQKTTKGETAANSPAPLIQSPKRTRRRTDGKSTPKVRQLVHQVPHP